MSNQTPARPNSFPTIFRWLMIFVAIYWVSTVAVLRGWPWDKSGQWQPDLPLVAVCANQAPCGVAYGQLAEDRAKGRISSLHPKEAGGEVSLGQGKEGEIWLHWDSIDGQAWQYEVKRSSWYSETRARYRLEGEQPVLVQSRDLVGGRALLYALPIALFFVAGLKLRTLRN